MGYTLSYLPASLWPKSGVPPSLPASEAPLLHSPRAMPREKGAQGHPNHRSAPQLHQHCLKQAELSQNTKTLQLPGQLWGVLSHQAAQVTEHRPYSLSPTPPCLQFSHRKGFDFSQIIRGNKEIEEIRKSMSKA